MRYPVRGEENSLPWKEGAQLGVCLTVTYLGCSTGGNKIPVPVLLLLFKEMERGGLEGRQNVVVLLLLYAKM